MAVRQREWPGEPMMDWLVARRHRLPMLLGVYFMAHILLRSSVSSSLDYDESEQVFLSQFLLLGYNSQPPLYTWMQAGLFKIFGYSIVPMALLKNSLLWMTYVLVFETVRKATGNLYLAAVATLGMFTIPQIAWESHRDLSHTVAATFVTSLLCYAVVSLGKSRPDHATRWYVLIGVAVGMGALFKYNFLLVVIAFVAAAVSVPGYRRLVLDRRLVISVLIAAAMVAPHAAWMIDHLDLVSGKTVSTMTEDQSEFWLTNVAQGMSAISVSLLGCLSGTVAMFFLLFVRRDSGSSRDTVAGDEATRLLLQRFLIVVMVLLVGIVLTGNAVQFKSRWFQPFLCLVPAYLSLCFGASVIVRRRAMNLSAWLTMGLLAVILGSVVARPILGAQRGKYCWLNIPYEGVAEAIRAKSEAPPEIIVTAHTRVAGNLKMQFPDSLVLSHDAMHLAEIARESHRQDKQLLIVSDHKSVDWIDGLAEFTRETLQRDFLDQGGCQVVDVDYNYGAEGDQRRFMFNEYRSLPISQPAQQIAELPEWYR